MQSSLHKGTRDLNHSKLGLTFARASPYSENATPRWYVSLTGVLFSLVDLTVPFSCACGELYEMNFTEEHW